MKLASYLEKSCISRRDFAAALGVSEATVTRYINGSRIPRPKHMERVKELSGGSVTADDFFASCDLSKADWPADVPRPTAPHDEEAA